MNILVEHRFCASRHLIGCRPPGCVKHQGVRRGVGRYLPGLTGCVKVIEPTANGAAQSTDACRCPATSPCSRRGSENGSSGSARAAAPATALASSLRSSDTPPGQTLAANLPSGRCRLLAKCLRQAEVGFSRARPVVPDESLETVPDVLDKRPADS